MNTGEIITRALEQLRTHGWTRGIRRNSSGQMCALGALDALMMKDHRAYTHLTEDRNLSYDAAVQVLARHIPSDWVCPYPNPDAFVMVAAYNNSRKDFSEVEEWFEKAAADERVA
jgi:hypothetical protein